ncbi:hypothetical protein FRB99_002737, partial [Tulasnella sp. 403]
GSCPSSTPGPGAGHLQYTGVDIAGFDFGCNSDGNCTPSAAWPPLVEYYGHDGFGQMQHFVSNGMSIFRLPVGWQAVTPTLGGPIDETLWTKYDTLVQDCLSLGVWCIIDIHNYARWGGKIIGQSSGAVTDAQFANLWSQIASRYKDVDKIIFGLMNEPHDVPDIHIWANMLQAAVNAVRQADATSQMILLSGNNWTSAATYAKLKTALLTL